MTFYYILSYIAHFLFYEYEVIFLIMAIGTQFVVILSLIVFSADLYDKYFLTVFSLLQKGIKF